MQCNCRCLSPEDVQIKYLRMCDAIACTLAKQLALPWCHPVCICLTCRDVNSADDDDQQTAVSSDSQQAQWRQGNPDKQSTASTTDMSSHRQGMQIQKVDELKAFPDAILQTGCKTKEKANLGHVMFAKADLGHVMFAKCMQARLHNVSCCS